MNNKEIFLNEKFMTNYQLTIDFINKVSCSDLNNCIQLFKKEKNMIDEKYDFKYNNRYTDDEALFAVYIRDLDLILNGIRYIQDESAGGWSGGESNNLQKERGEKLRKLIEDKIANNN